MRYKTAAALEMAVRDAAKASPQDTNRAIAGFYFHRLLCRVFSEPDPRFVLKGGLGMLARVPDARSTRDIDLSTEAYSGKEAVEELKRLAAKDLEDFVTFRFEGAVRIRLDDGYRSGHKVTFVPLLGGRPMSRVSVDLVADSIPCGSPDRVSPADRLAIEGIPTCEYLVYPVASAVADKVSGVMEVHDGRPSSRLKDLVDIAVYLTRERFALSDLRERLQLEVTLRNLDISGGFAVPATWENTAYASSYQRLAGKTGLPSELRDMHAAESLARRCINPALDDGLPDTNEWDPERRQWVKPTSY